jgi:hypothetical protein
MPDKHGMADVRITFRLPRDLDQGMRESAEFFGRSVGAEWRTAAQLYRRVLAAWSTAVMGVADGSSPAAGDGAANERLLLRLCDGLLREPQSLASLTAALSVNADDIPLRSSRSALNRGSAVDATSGAALRPAPATNPLIPPQECERSACTPSVRGEAADLGDRNDPAYTDSRSPR